MPIELTWGLVVSILLAIGAAGGAITRSVFSSPNVVIPRELYEEKELEQRQGREEFLQEVRTMIQTEMGRLKQEIIKEELPFHKKADLNQDLLKLLLASQIERIYWSGFYKKTIFLHSQETLHTMHGAYKALKGNGYIDNLVEQMKTWEIVDESLKN